MKSAPVARPSVAGRRGLFLSPYNSIPGLFSDSRSGEVAFDTLGPAFRVDQWESLAVPRAGALDKRLSHGVLVEDVIEQPRPDRATEQPTGIDR